MIARDHTRVAATEVDEDGWDGMSYYKGQHFSGITFEEKGGTLVGEQWYAQGLADGWGWRVTDPDGELWIGHAFKNMPHGESWRFGQDLDLKWWTVWEYGLFVRLENYSPDADPKRAATLIEGSRKAVERQRAERGIIGETDPLIYPLRGSHYDTKLIIREFFEPYR